MKFPICDFRTPEEVSENHARMTRPNRKLHRAFSLVEVVAAIAIIGIVTFLAIPNLIQIKEDGERNLAKSRAEALNMAMVSYLQVHGSVTAQSAWSGADNDGKYGLIRGYAAFSPGTLGEYMPAGYGISFPPSLADLSSTNMVYATDAGGVRIW